MLTDLGFLEGRHDLSSLVLQLLQLLGQLGHQLRVVLQLRLHAGHALLALLQVAAATRKHVHSPRSWRSMISRTFRSGPAAAGHDDPSLTGLPS